MIHGYLVVDDKIVETDDLNKAIWINMVNPTNEEIHTIVENLKISQEFIRYPLDEEEPSRIERDEGQILITIRIPDPRHEKDMIKYETIPLGIILNGHKILTVSLKNPPFLEDFILIKDAKTLLEDHTKFVCHIFLRTSNMFLRGLRLIDRLIYEYEEELLRSMRNKELIKLLYLEKSLVYFNTSLKANDLVMARIQSGRIIPVNEENEELLYDAQIENQQAIEMAKIFSDILSGLMDAYASIISNNLNTVMKFLTAFTIILMLPNLIASIYGMNIALPFQEEEYAFALIMSFSFTISLLAAYILYKKKMW